MKQIIKNILIGIIFILCLGICFYNIKTKSNEENTTNNNIIENTVIEEQIEQQVEKEEEEEIKEELPPETYTTMYASVGLNVRQEPHLDSTIVDTVGINTELQTVDGTDNNGWIKIKIDSEYYYVASEYLSKEKVKIEQPKIAETSNNNNTTTTTKKYNNQNNTGVLTKSKGVNYYNGHRETWYSQKVLPGGGLKIPGRHVDDRGLVCDGDGYICVASSDYAKGTIVETSLGTGKVYDCGCASGTIDIYTDW